MKPVRKLTTDAFGPVKASWVRSEQFETVVGS